MTIVIDAQRNELYVAKFELDDAEARMTEGLRLAPISSVMDEPTVAGPEAQKWFSRAKILFPSALRTAILAAGKSDFVSGEKLEPIYLRPVAFVKAPAPREICAD